MSKKTIIILTAICQLVLLFSPYIPWVSEIWNVAEFKTLVERIIVLIIIEFIVLTTSILLILNQEMTEAKGWREEISNFIPQIEIKPIADYEFYTDFLRSAMNASHSVSISYLSPNAPDYIQKTDRKKYYEDIIGCIKNNPRISFQRLIRKSPSNDVWVTELTRELLGIPNHSLAILKDLNEAEVMPLSLSVQIVDNDLTWLVAIASHERRGRYRDLFIKDVNMAEAMKNYYNRLWNNSILILDSGNLTVAGSELLERFNNNGEA